MGQRLIITEEEKKTILSLYEQTDEQYKKENDFLQRYVGKTFNIYTGPDFQTLASGKPIKINTISYKGETESGYMAGIIINGKQGEFGRYFFECVQNPDRIGYVDSTDKPKYLWYNKTLIDNINQQGAAIGIKWCKKPKADFAMKQSDSETDKMV